MVWMVDGVDGVDGRGNNNDGVYGRNAHFICQRIQAFEYYAYVYHIRTHHGLIGAQGCEHRTHAHARTHVRS